MSEIDVSKCYFCNTTDYSLPVCEQKKYRNEIDSLCRDNPNCYYKQLQQLKAENETLNTLFKNYKKEYIDSTYKLGEMVLKNGNLYNEKEKYKNALDEIEQICEEQNLKYDITACDILQKIKEVKEGKE